MEISKFFQKYVDTDNRLSMIDFLKNHDKYYLNGSWNGRKMLC